MPPPLQSQTLSDLILNIGGPAEAEAASKSMKAPVAAATPTPVTPAPVISEAAPPALASAPERGVQMDGTYKGKDITIYTSTGDSHTAQEFDAALTAYNQTNILPPGFTVLEPGTMSNVRSIFETVRAPLRKAVEELDDPNLPLNTYLPGFVSAVPKFLARQVGEQVKTPAKAAMFFGTLAAGPFLGPTTTLAGKMNIPGMALNTVKTAIGAVGGATIADVATGEAVTPGKIAAELAMVTAGGTAQGLISHMVTKYIPQRLQEKVLRNIYDDVVAKYPQLANNPKAINIAGSVGTELTRMGKQMSAGLRGGVNELAESLVADINNVMPTSALTPQARGLAVGLQATLRAKGRAFARASQDMLDNLDDPQAYATASKAFNDATADIGQFVKTEVAKFMQTNVQQYANNPQAFAQDMPKIAQRIAGVLQQHRTSMNQFEEGAQALYYFNKATAGNKGFDPVTLRNEFMKSYTGNEHQLLQTVRDTLAGQNLRGGQGRDLLDPLQVITENKLDPLAMLGNMIKRQIPFVKSIPAGSPRLTTRTPVLPYQRPAQAPYVLNVGSQLAGQDAIRSFFDTETK